MLAQFIGGTGGTKVMHQRLVVVLGSGAQMAQRVTPLALGQLSQTAA